MVFCVLMLNVLFVDLVVDVRKFVMMEDVNLVFIKVVEGLLKNILNLIMELFVLIDFNINFYLVIVDGLFMIVMEDYKIKVLVWYDNEWGYLQCVVDLVRYIVVEMCNGLKIRVS